MPNKYKCVCTHKDFNRGDIITEEQYQTAVQGYFVKVLDNNDLDKLKQDKMKMVNDKTTVTK